MNVKTLLKEHNVDLVCMPLDGNGCYIPEFNTMFVDNRLSEIESNKVALHELGHAALHQDNKDLYHLAFSLHSKMENEAEEFMIEQMIEFHLDNPDVEPENINIIKFMDDRNIDYRYEHVVRVLMMDCIGNMNLQGKYM